VAFALSECHPFCFNDTIFSMKAVYRALIVEDSIDVRRVLKTSMELMLEGFQVADVPSAEEALLEFHRQPVDLLITDMRLPGMTGVELMERMRLRKPDLKAIMVTGMTDPEYRLQAESSPADAFFQKPIDIPTLIQKVRTLFAISDPAATTGEAMAPLASSPSEWLAWLRLEIRATGAFLLNERGKIVAQTGEASLIDEEGDLVMALMSVLSSGRKAAQVAGRLPAHSLFSLAGMQIDLYFAPVGAAYSLLVVKPHRPDGLFDLPYDKFQHAIAGLMGALDAMGIPIAEDDQPVSKPATGPLPELVPNEHDEDLTALVLGESPVELAPDQVDAFWENLEGEEGVVISGKAEVLSYEEARRLGLTPDQQAD
jgi:CheY-like chemotaxis protein